MRALRLAPGQIHTGSLILVNRDHDYREPASSPAASPGEGAGRGRPGGEALSAVGAFPAVSFAFRGTGRGDGPAPVLLKRRAAVLFAGLMDEIGGWSRIVPVSGYRTFEEQSDLWDSSLAEHGPAFTRAYVAPPGHSEHQTGLALDLGLKKKEIDFLCPDFPDSGICRAFREQAARYGFIRRYPGGKEAVTGIAHEPWHFRYVGTPHGEIMEKEGLTLEEYVFFLRDFPHGKRPYLFLSGGRQIAVSWLRAGKDEVTWLSVDGRLPYSVSGDNVNGFIVTEWREAHVS